MDLLRRRQPPRDDAAPRILVVCTGNVCRSPFVTALLRAALPDVPVDSAGVGALVGEPPTDTVQDLLLERGLAVPDDDVAQQVTRSLVRSASLIVTATRLHRVEIVRLDGSAATRAFTLKELARVLADAPTGLGVVAAAAYVAERTEDGREHDDDLDDPYGLDEDAYRAMAAEVDTALTPIVRALRA